MVSTETRVHTNQPTFFDFAAEVGLTKHIGGVDATEAIIQMCHIGKDSYILDVGCGVGATACFVARKVGCRVVGVDILNKMVERSKDRAKHQNLARSVEFRVADAQNLPFEDDLFDAVITESVTAFPEDKQKAINEYRRVTRPGGYVGLNESVWLKVPPPPEVISWAAQDVGASVKQLTPEAWSGLLETAGLKNITTKTYSVNVQEEAKGILRRYGFWETIEIIIRMLRLYAKNPAYRKFVKEIRGTGILPENLDEYFGYGLFVGIK